MNEKILTIENLTVSFDGFKALNNLNFSLDTGELRVIIGPNGAGKTTAMRMLCGLSLPSSGKATVAGFDVFKENEKIKRSSLPFSPSPSNTPPHPPNTDLPRTLSLSQYQQ